MSNSSGWPTFIVIGAPRCGTTSLHNYLGQHPQVLMSEVKEPNYFMGEDVVRAFAGPGADMIRRQSILDESGYRQLFPRREGVLAYGESSPRYLSNPGTAGRIRNRLPAVKLVAILRNPVDRLLSEFALRVRDGWEPCSRVEDALADEARRLAEHWATGVYRQRGHYGLQLRDYFSAFPREQLRIFLYEDLVSRPDALFDELFAFIGVDPAFRPTMEKSLNVSGVIRNPLLRFIWTRSNRLKDVVRPLLPQGLRRHISEFFISQGKDKLTYSPALRQELTAGYTDDILELQSLIDGDLSHWLSTRRE